MEKYPGTILLIQNEYHLVADYLPKRLVHIKVI